MGNTPAGRIGIGAAEFEPAIDQQVDTPRHRNLTAGPLVEFGTVKRIGSDRAGEGEFDQVPQRPHRTVRKFDDVDRGLSAKARIHEANAVSRALDIEDQIVRARLAHDYIRRSDIGREYEAIFARDIGQRILPVSAREVIDIIARAAAHGVVARPARQGVVAISAIERIVVAQALQHIVTA